MEMWPYSYFWWCGYSQGPWVSFVTIDKFQIRVTKITSRIGDSWIHSLPVWFLLLFSRNGMAILSKVCKPDNFELHNSLNLALTILEIFVIILLDLNLLLNQTLLICLLFVRQTWKTQLKKTQFFCEGLSSFNSKGFCGSYAWCCSLFEGGTFA